MAVGGWFNNHFTRQYIPEDNSEHHTRRRENLKSHIYNNTGNILIDFAPFNPLKFLNAFY
jgi:hypothetical protein